MRACRLWPAALALLAAACSSEKPRPASPPRPEKPPEVYRVRLETTKGDIIVEAHREWAPRGADQFYELVENRFYDGARFFRVVRGFVVQFGIHGDPAVQRLWGDMKIRDDPVKQSNRKGFVSFAKLGPNSRTTQVFINLRDNVELDSEGFAPFARVVEGMDVVERLWSNYGETPPRGRGPDPARILREGNAYLEKEFPRLDAIVRARIVRD
jgi:peptidyl-prolyl cis-trans isomerase A (cyclophilin A)